MKNLFKKSMILLAAGILLSLNSSANAQDAPGKSALTEASKIIGGQIKYPEVLKHPEKVNVVFTVNSLGEVDLVIANTVNEALKKSIEMQFRKLKLNHLIANNAYSVVVNFKTV